MSQPYVGEIRMMGSNFPPNGWAFCAGQLLPISENETLFNLIGTTYGGDGEETFALPNLQGRLPIHQGQGPGLSTYVMGEMGGAETITLNTGQIPSHTHPFIISNNAASASTPNGNVVGNGTANLFIRDTLNGSMNSNSVGQMGGSQPHENMMPYLVVNFAISLFGIFPSQT